MHTERPVYEKINEFIIASKEKGLSDYQIVTGLNSRDFLSQGKLWTKRKYKTYLMNHQSKLKAKETTATYNVPVTLKTTTSFETKEDTQLQLITLILNKSTLPSQQKLEVIKSIIL